MRDRSELLRNYLELEVTKDSAAVRAKTSLEFEIASGKQMTPKEIDGYLEGYRKGYLAASIGHLDILTKKGK